MKSYSGVNQLTVETGYDQNICDLVAIIVQECNGETTPRIHPETRQWRPYMTTCAEV